MIEELQPVAFPLVNRFFKANGHKGKARSNERVFALRKEGKIIAALRACRRSEGYLLRSVWVAVPERGCGYGLELVRHSVQALSVQPLSEQASPPARCWCYPYSHLEHFYTLAGFKELPASCVPDDISAPWLSYKKNGQGFLLMEHCY